MVDIEDPAALRAYLTDTGRIAADQDVDIRILAGGISNKTVWVGKANGEAWVLKQACAQLRVQTDWFSDPARVQQEALGIRYLGELVPGQVSPLIFEDPEIHLLAMGAVDEPHEVWKAVLMAGRGTEWQAAAFGQLLGQVHRHAWQRREQLQPIFKYRGYFESLRLEPYYGFTSQQCPDAAVFLEQLCQTTREQSITLVHGDYSPKNVLIHDGHLMLLDHEVIHWGDPAFDLGFSLTHLLSKANHLPAHRQAFRTLATAAWSNYQLQVAGLPWAGALEPRAVRHTLGCLLARVDGRSPLEYLTESQRDRQRRAVLSIIDQPPARLPALFDAFLEKI